MSLNLSVWRYKSGCTALPVICVWERMRLFTLQDLFVVLMISSIFFFLIIALSLKTSLSSLIPHWFWVLGEKRPNPFLLWCWDRAASSGSSYYPKAFPFEKVPQHYAAFWILKSPIAGPLAEKVFKKLCQAGVKELCHVFSSFPLPASVLGQDWTRRLVLVMRSWAEGSSTLLQGKTNTVAQQN